MKLSQGRQIIALKMGRVVDIKQHSYTHSLCNVLYLLLVEHLLEQYFITSTHPPPIFVVSPDDSSQPLCFVAHFMSTILQKVQTARSSFTCLFIFYSLQLPPAFPPPPSKHHLQAVKTCDIFLAFVCSLDPFFC